MALDVLDVLAALDNVGEGADEEVDEVEAVDVEDDEALVEVDDALVEVDETVLLVVSAFDEDVETASVVTTMLTASRSEFR